MPEPITYILFSGVQYYPEGGAGDKTVVIRAEDDDAAMEQAEAVGLSATTADWFRLDKIEGDQLVAVYQGWVGECPTRDCEFRSLDAEAMCPLHDRKTYWCGYALRVNMVPEEIEVTVVKDPDV